MVPHTLTFATIPNRLSGGSPIELSTERILCNDITFADERHPHRMRPWIIGNEYGALCLVWASCEQDAFDEACDADMLAGLAIDDEYYRELCAEACEDAGCHGLQCPWKEDASACHCDHTCNTPDSIMLLGNASEPFDSEHAWLCEVELSPLQERYFAEARGAGVDTLDKL